MAANGFASSPFTGGGSSGNANANSIYVTKVTLVRSATVSAIWLHVVSAAGSLNIKGVIYDSAHSVLLAASVNVTSVIASGNRLVLPATVVLSAGTYYVGYVCNTAINVLIDNAQAGSSWWVNGGQSVASPANPLVGGSVSGAGLLVALEFDGSATYGFGPDYTSGITLGGTFLTNDATTTAASLMGARSVVTAAADRRYAEIVVTGTLNATNTRIGLSTGSWALSTVATTNTSFFSLYQSNGTVSAGTNGNTATLTAFVSGDVIGVAFDNRPGFGNVTYNRNGGAFSSALSLGGPAQTWPVMVQIISNTAATFTLRDTAAALQFTPPAGYVAWSAATLPTGSQARAWILA